MLLFGMHSDPSRRPCVCVCWEVGLLSKCQAVRPLRKEQKWGGKQGLRKSSMDILHHLVYNLYVIHMESRGGGQVLHQASVMTSWGHMKSFIGWGFICLLHNPCCGLKSWQRRTMSLYGPVSGRFVPFVSLLLNSPGTRHPQYQYTHIYM